LRGGVRLAGAVVVHASAAPVPGAVVGADPMTGALLAGAGVGVGVLLVVLGLRPAAPTLAAALAEIDAARWVPAAPAPDRGRVSRRLARDLARTWSARGWLTPSLRADLAVVGVDLDSFLLRKAGWAAIGLLAPPLLAVAWSAV